MPDNGSDAIGDEIPGVFLKRHADRIFDSRFSMESGRFSFCGIEIPCRRGILRFIPDASYSSGSFDRLRDLHPTLQLDSVTGLEVTYRTILQRTNWPAEYFQGKLILECGCGAGPDTEVLRRLGAHVVSVDLAGTDIAQRNVGSGDCNIFIQGSILELPFKKESFDIVFCHRVLQHTPDPEQTLRCILEYVRPDGAAFVHSYARNAAQMLGWKYVLRPLTTRMNPETLYSLIKWYAPTALRITSALRMVRPESLGLFLFRVAGRIVPLYNYRFVPDFMDMPDEYILEYAIHNTFDALSPRFDNPMKASDMRRIARSALRTPFEVVERGTVILLRTFAGRGMFAVRE